MIMMTVLCIILGYLLGSIPFALVIGKLFYKTDIRQYGSGNLGGTNAGRVLGKKAGISVIVLDVLKVVLAAGLASLVSEPAAIWTSLACCIGHCYPIFAHFKGGKAVTTMFGFLISTSIFIFQEFSYFLVPLFMFLIILYLFKYVSLGSICASVCSSLYITAQLLSLDVNNLFIILASWLMTLLVIYRHSANIKRIQEGTENKVSWL
ncbi:glycerol-3-phosphate 1-O-acyltransferase PlsY [Faecalitalea cylindroides]|jgi:glycerol-3-phosphate acyltransferase PlsY|uniref:Glycerol-3-phosphate acyltransferase n=3 Tax=Faecalitalea cylindroides TaxID=39483 RepID=A0AAW6FNP7_9FIRM|nr:glycerol-3-phosphate 1-O-acyltransferase PlsY [Faecalitalea cylindroides]ERK46493.1 acyl-phosphate glycerol 3-phosphate acyltransferase [[Eubacterium] cylindroides ATCC 27803] [Faecalitalea cylindroides ATCC 27803]MBM6652210.1 glycerol-3-phosphate 1-O-acyltransferase PlsY [Faecalitalea cylindroides]MBM6811245.1 glycerol-3-phosphate 1-O-acyltransferase PlsY [Faecalitalea cylindroides]MDB7946601.1 glycerol-3-phosphate 1-O-acyltransferase PlsY [Faecalitalea cylindroides]MDB7948464.1 glycerol-3